MSRHLILSCVLLCSFYGGVAESQQNREPMPRADVIDVPAIGEGLCVSNVFQSNMVLQRDRPINVWGWAEPGEQVTVTFAGEQASVKAGEDRAWKVTLPAVPAHSNPQQMTVEGKSKTLVLDNILIGDVWLCGGQSNMEWSVGRSNNAEEEIANANYPHIRLLDVPHHVAFRPEADTAAAPRVYQMDRPAPRPAAR